MKLLILMTVLLAGVVSAEEKKRPSWSQGLPEKSEVPDMGRPELSTPSLRPESMDVEIDISRDELMTLPEMNTAPAMNSSTVETPEPVEVEPVAEAVSLQSVEAEPTPVEIDADAVNDESTATMTAAEPAQPEAGEAVTVISSAATSAQNQAPYSWAVRRQFPVRVSANILSQYNNVLLKVMINNAGEVISVEKAIASTPDLLVQQAERSVKRWQFAPPAEEGISESMLSRVLQVPLTGR